MVFIIGSIVVAVVSVILCLVICLQEAKQAGLGAGIAGGSDTYWSKNKSRSKEGKLVRITVIAAIAFFVIAILLNIGAVANPETVNASNQTDSAVVETVADEENASEGSEDADAADAAEGASEEAGAADQTEEAAGETEAAGN